MVLMTHITNGAGYLLLKGTVEVSSGFGLATVKIAVLGIMEEGPQHFRPILSTGANIARIDRRIDHALEAGARCKDV